MFITPPPITSPSDVPKSHGGQQFGLFQILVLTVVVTASALLLGGISLYCLSSKGAAHQPITPRRDTAETADDNEKPVTTERATDAPVKSQSSESSKDERNADAALGKQGQEQVTLLPESWIDYDTFYAEARTTGLKVGQRYHFSAQYPDGDYLYSSPGKTLSASPAFDDPAQYTTFLKGDTWASRTIVATVEDDGRIYVHAVE
jgi:hypothetical protein